MNSDRFWAQSLYPNVSLDKLLAPNLDYTPGTLKWGVEDWSTDGAAHFTSSVVISRPLDALSGETAFYRLLCMALLAQIDHKSIKEAYESLVEIHHWQVESAKRAPHKPSNVHYLDVSDIQTAERQPFGWDP
jgi:hypothetical protein